MGWRCRPLHRSRDVRRLPGRREARCDDNADAPARFALPLRSGTTQTCHGRPARPHLASALANQATRKGQIPMRKLIITAVSVAALAIPTVAMAAAPNGDFNFKTNG